MIEAITNNLTRGIKLLSYITDEQYSDTSVAPYYSSIGEHMRHVLDIFDCIFTGIEIDKIDLTARKRNEIAEKKTREGLHYFDRITVQLLALQYKDLNRIIKVTDDLGLGMVEANYTLAGVLVQAHSHAIHHFASIGYVIAQLGIDLPDEDFGFNPSTPRLQKQR